jgi:hypothetical protein
VGYGFPDYHKPGDEWPKLDYDNLAKVDLTVALAVLWVADSVEAPQWNKELPKHRSLHQSPPGFARQAIVPDGGTIG